MYKKVRPSKGTLRVYEGYIAESLEDKISRMMNNKEPIGESTEMRFTERKDGVRPEYDIRTDRFEHALDAADYIDRSHKAKRERAMGERTFDTMSKEQQEAFHKKFPTNKHNFRKESETGGQSTGGTE